MCSLKASNSIPVQNPREKKKNFKCWFMGPSTSLPPSIVEEKCSLEIHAFTPTCLGVHFLDDVHDFHPLLLVGRDSFFLFFCRNGFFTVDFMGS